MAKPLGIGERIGDNEVGVRSGRSSLQRVVVVDVIDPVRRRGHFAESD